MCNIKLFILFQLPFCIAEPFTLVTEKPVLSYSDKSVFSFANVTAVRYGRNSLQYYTTAHFVVDVPLDDSYIVEIIFYENLNNQFRRSFIEMQFKLCTFIFKDPLFGAAIRKQITVQRCPIPTGPFSLYNMTAAGNHLPRLPFTKGRIYMYLKLKSKAILKGYCDMELKRKKHVKNLN